MDNTESIEPQPPPQTMPSQPLNQDDRNVYPRQQNVIPEQTPKTNHPRKIIMIVTVVLIILIILGLSVYLLVKSIKREGSGASITKTTSESDSTKYTSFQLDDTERKELTTACFISVIPKSALITSEPGDDCTLNITMPDTTTPFVHIIAINDPPDQNIREAAYLAKKVYDQKFKESGNTKYSSQIIENISVGGSNSYLLKYTDGVYRYQTYFVEASKDSNYTVDGKKVLIFFINGSENNPKVDVFTKYFNLFIENLKFN